MRAIDLFNQMGIKLQEPSPKTEPEKKYGPTLTLVIEMEKQHRAEANQAGFKVVDPKSTKA